MEILRKLDRILILKRDERSDFLYNPTQEVIKDFQQITLNGVVYEYYRPNKKVDFSIGPVNLSIRKREILFIAGGNGSGKSTLLKILTGLYTPSVGGFQIDNKDIAMPEHRNLFSAVFEDFHLFDRLYGLDKIDENDISRLLMQKNGPK